MTSMRRMLLCFALFAVTTNPLFGGSHVRSQEATPPDPTDQAPILWRASIPGDLWKFDYPAVFGQEQLYVVGEDQSLYAFAIDDGRLLWKRPVSLPVLPIEVTANDEVVVVTRRDGMEVFDATTGQSLWRRTAADPIDSFPKASFAGELIVTSELIDDRTQEHSTGIVFGLSIETGEERWRVETGGIDSWQIPVEDGVAYVSGSDGNVVAIHTQSGDIIWRRSVSSTGYLWPRIIGDQVLIQGRTPQGTTILTAVDRLAGTVNWSIDLEGDLQGFIHSQAIVSKLPDESGEFSTIGIDVRSGVETWRIDDAAAWAVTSGETAGFISAYAPDLTDSTSGRLMQIDPESGAIAWSLSTAEPSESIQLTGGKLIVGYETHVIVVDADTGDAYYDFFAGEPILQVLGDSNDGEAAIVSADGSVFMLDTTKSPSFLPSTIDLSSSDIHVFSSLAVEPSPLQNMILVLWRAIIGPDEFTSFPMSGSGLTGYVESGSVEFNRRVQVGTDFHLEPATGALTGESFLLPGSGLAMKSSFPGPATVYITGILPFETLLDLQISSVFFPLGSAPIASLPSDEARVAVSRVMIDPSNGTTPRLDSWPAIVSVVSGSATIAMTPGMSDAANPMQNPSFSVDVAEGRSAPVPPDTIFSIVGDTQPVEVYLTTVISTANLPPGGGCANRCIVR